MSGTKPGHRHVRRHNASRSSTSNSTAASLTYDTNVISPEGGLVYDGPGLTVDQDGVYILVYDLGQVDLGGSTRAVGTLVPRVNGVDQGAKRASHRYLRNSGGAQHNASFAVCMHKFNADEDWEVRVPGTLTVTDAVGNYGTNLGFGGGMQTIYLGNGNYTEIFANSNRTDIGETNAATTRPWLDTTPSMGNVVATNELYDDDDLWTSGTDVDLKANTKYAIGWNLVGYSTDATRHNYFSRLRFNDSDNRQFTSAYQRNTSSQGSGQSGLYFYETGGSDETVRVQSTVEAESAGSIGTPVVNRFDIQVYELPSSAEWIEVTCGATDVHTSSLAGTSTWYNTPFSDVTREDGTGRLTLDGDSFSVKQSTGASIPVLCVGNLVWDRDTNTSTTRKAPWMGFQLDGSQLGYGISGGYSRGAASDETWLAAMVSVATFDLPSGGTGIRLTALDESNGSNNSMGVFSSGNEYFSYMQVLLLDTLGTASPSMLGSMQRNIAANAVYRR